MLYNNIKTKFMVLGLRISQKFILLLLSLIRLGTYILNTVITPKFIIKILTILFIILLNGGTTASLDETDSEDESEAKPEPKQDKGKGVDKGSSSETNTTTNPSEGDTGEAKTGEAAQAPPVGYQPGTVSETMLKIYKMMADHENALLEAEKAEFERTGVLPEENLHDKISEFRKDDEAEMKIIRDKMEKARLEDTPGDVGSSQNKRDLVQEEGMVENKKVKEDTSSVAKPSK